MGLRNWTSLFLLSVLIALGTSIKADAVGTCNITANTVQSTGSATLGSNLTSPVSIYGKPLVLQGLNNNGTDIMTGVSINGVINVQAYGAKCDGTTDDTVAMNSALAACGTSTVTAVEIPVASCAISGYINIPSNCTLRGRGPSSKITELATATSAKCANVNNIGLIQSTNTSNVVVRDLQIVGQGNHSANCTGVEIQKVTNAAIDNVFVNNPDYNGIMADSTTRFSIRNNRVVTPQYFGIVVYNMTSSSQEFSIINNVLENTGGDSIFVAITPIPQVATDTPRGSSDFVITNNVVYNAGDAGIEVGAVSNNSVQNTNFAINDNEVDGSINDGILIRNDSQFTVTGNTLANNGTSANAQIQDEISLYAAEANVNDGSVVGNHMTPQFGSGVGMTQGTDLAGNKNVIARVVIANNSVTFPAKAFTCAAGGRNGIGIVANLYAAGYPASSDISIIGNVMSGVSCIGIAVNGLSWAVPMVGVIIEANQVVSQNLTGSVGIGCTSADCSILDNTISTVATGISTAYCDPLITRGNRFLGTVTAQYNADTNSTYGATDFHLTPLQLGKMPVVPGAPSAGNCQLFVVAGTNAGTCKIQAVCGTSATPVTVLDNIGSGC